MSLPQSFPPQQPWPPQAVLQQPVRRKAQPWVWAVAVSAVLMVALVAAIVAAIANASRSDSETGATRAKETCQTAVQERLKSPASAQFSEASVSHRPGETADFYTVSGSVDSQNSFGAMLRSNYKCDLTLERDGTWRTTNFVLR